MRLLQHTPSSPGFVITGETPEFIRRTAPRRVPTIPFAAVATVAAAFALLVALGSDRGRSAAAPAVSARVDLSVVIPRVTVTIAPPSRPRTQRRLRRSARLRREPAAAPRQRPIEPPAQSAGTQESPSRRPGRTPPPAAPGPGEFF
jgi:hypothetical protein